MAAAAGLETPHGTPAPTAPQHKPEGRLGYPQLPCNPQNWREDLLIRAGLDMLWRTRWQHRDRESLVEAVLLGRALLKKLGRAPCFPLCRHSCIKQLTARLYKGLRACWK